MPVKGVRCVPLLVLNAGSSSLKFALFEAAGTVDGPALRIRGQIADIGRRSRFSAVRDGKAVTGGAPADGTVGDHADAFSALFGWLQGQGFPLSALAGIGHRVVHGGARFAEPVVVTAEIVAELETLAPLAPHHMPHNVGAIRACRERAAGLPQIACFDTGFHAGQPELEKRLPLPKRFDDRGLRRYGFHGLSYEHVVDTLPRIAGDRTPDRLIVFHLGNGASACAIRNGRSAGTTMGFSTVDGLVMGTRSGGIDPGALIYLMRNEGYDADTLEDLLYNRAGLLGLSETSSDMRDLLASQRPEARFAVDKYCLAAARQAASLVPLIGGLDGLVFTGGVGENAAAVRKGIVDRLAWLGAGLDAAANAAAAPDLAAAGSPVGIWIVPANEELTIARHTAALIADREAPMRAAPASAG